VPPWRADVTPGSTPAQRRVLLLERKMDQQEEAEEAENEGLTPIEQFICKGRNWAWQFWFQLVDSLLSLLPPVQTHFGLPVKRCLKDEV